MSDHEPARRTPLGEDTALSYAAIRRVIGLAGIALPFVLGAAAVHDGTLKDSMSSYYYSGLRDYFTGTMCVIGVFLFCYEFRAPHVEAWLAKLAGLAALGVAFFHTAPIGPVSSGVRVRSDIHFGCAAVLFAILGDIAFQFFPSAQSAAELRAHERRFYRACGLVIWGGIAGYAVASNAFPGFCHHHPVLFWVETACVLAFSLSFLVKGQFADGMRTLMRPNRSDQESECLPRGG
ncbi:MAG TPA: hypothetical protein VG899_10125 [Mycobacteriales bacterium]|nr:hypothetical protein [Mycobacteriales bacterium]